MKTRIALLGATALAVFGLVGLPATAARSPVYLKGAAAAVVSVTQGQTATASPGTWTGTAPIAFAYQWERCDNAGASCADITGATSTTYSVVAADVGSTLRVKVTGTNVAGSSTAVSDATGVVQGLPPVNTSLPTISVS